MATPTYDPIASTTLTLPAISVTFSSLDTIAAGYRDLVLVIDGVSALGSFDGTYSLNGDTTSGNYESVTMAGNGSSTISYNTSSGVGRRWSTETTFTTTDRSISVAHFFDFAVTNKHKSSLWRANRASKGTEASALRWANTAAITSIQIAGGTFAAGSVFSIYGIVA